MPSDPSRALAEVRAAVRPHRHLAAVLDTALEATIRPDTTLAAGGSLGRCTVDSYSDIDLVVLAATGPQASGIEHAMDVAFRSRFDVLTAYDNAAVGLASLRSTIVAGPHGVTKVDAVCWSTDKGVPRVGGTVIHDGLDAADLLARVIDRSGVDLERAPVEIVGWSWYVLSRSGRGELFEAAHALDAIRRRMVVPFLLRAHGLPQVNYRRVEARLPPEARERLVATYPTQLTGAEIARALRSLVALFLDLAPEQHEVEAGLRRVLGRRPTDMPVSP